MNKMTDGAAGNGARIPYRKVSEDRSKMLESEKPRCSSGMRKDSSSSNDSCFHYLSEDTVRLVWTPFFENNLTVYLPEYKEGRCYCRTYRKGCDVRTLVNLILENQISRDRVKIIGVPCEGVIDRAKVAKVLGTDRIIRDSKVAGPSLVLEGDGFEVEIEIEDVLADPCEACRHPVPVIYDVLAGNGYEVSKDENPERAYLEIKQFVELPSDERFSFFARKIEECIQCYACRQACPLCYFPSALSIGRP